MPRKPIITSIPPSRVVPLRRADQRLLAALEGDAMEALADLAALRTAQAVGLALLRRSDALAHQADELVAAARRALADHAEPVHQRAGRVADLLAAYGPLRQRARLAERAACLHLADGATGRLDAADRSARNVVDRCERALRQSPPDRAA